MWRNLNGWESDSFSPFFCGESVSGKRKCVAYLGSFACHQDCKDVSLSPLFLSPSLPVSLVFRPLWWYPTLPASTRVHVEKGEFKRSEFALTDGEKVGPSVEHKRQGKNKSPPPPPTLNAWKSVFLRATSGLTYLGR